MSSFFLGVLSTGSIFIGFIVYFVLHPEKFEKWLGMFFRVASFFSKKAEYLSTKYDIQGKINSFVRELESNTTLHFPNIFIRWTGRDNEDDLVYEDGQIIIVMRDKGYKNKNFVHAAYFFTSEVLFKNSKRHLSKSQKISLDLFATKKIIESKNKAALDQFMKDYFIPDIDNSKRVKKLIKKYVDIDKLGIFFPVLVQELIYLGNKIFLSKPSNQVIEEVKGLTLFLENFSKREVGDMSVSRQFVGRYMRCAIRIVSSYYTRQKGKTESQRKDIVNLIKRGFENVYVLGDAGKENKVFMKRVCNDVLKEQKQIECVKERDFEGGIIKKGKRVRVSTYFVHLRNPDVVKYLYEQSDIDNL